MKKTIKNIVRFFLTSSFALLLTATLVSAAPVVRKAAGANPAAIQATVDQFRADLGGQLNPNTAQTFITGRREINWDGVPDSFSVPNLFPGNFFNSNSPRGVILTAPDSPDSGDLANFRVSSSTASGVPVRFGNFNANFAAMFQTFSAERLFIARETNILTVQFFIPGTGIPATVSGFGVVFADVDFLATSVRFYGANGRLLTLQIPDAANNGLSFVGVSFNAGERIARVEIVAGTVPLIAANENQGVTDIVAMDDFIYGEPRAIGNHSSDFDGDGTSDFAVFRPASGQWFILNSGANTFTAVQFGQNGDVPVDGDFDGDSRNDITVFRPSSGTWFLLKTGNGQFQATQFGQNGDKPVPADYDKDGVTDIAVWRPSSGSYFFLRSSNGAFQATQWGANGDIPIQSALVP